MNLMQRLVISNLFGFGFVAVSWVAAILSYEASESRGSWSLPWLIGSLLLIVLDVGYRYRGSGRSRGAKRIKRMELYRACGIIGSRYNRCVTNRFSRVGSRNLVSGCLCGAERSRPSLEKQPSPDDWLIVQNASTAI